MTKTTTRLSAEIREVFEIEPEFGKLVEGLLPETAA